MWLFPVTFDDPSVPDIDYTARYAGTGAGMHSVPPTGVPGYAFHQADRGDMLPTSPVALPFVDDELAPFPPIAIMLAQKAAFDPATQQTHVVPAKVAALGKLDAGDLVYPDDDGLVSTYVGVVP